MNRHSIAVNEEGLRWRRYATAAIAFLLVSSATAPLHGQVEDVDSLLKVAARQGDLEQVRSLLAAGADPNARDQRGLTPLLQAVASPLREDQAARGLAVVVVLLAAGADANAQAPSGGTALMSASLRGRTEVVRVLLAHGADPDVYQTRGSTALWKAARNGHTGVVRVLLEAGADPKLFNESRNSPLIAAAQSGRVESVRLLLEYGADTEIRDSEGETALSAAEGMLTVLEQLPPDMKNRSQPGVDFAAVVEVLKNGGASVEPPEARNLHEAAMYGGLDDVRRYLAEGADVSSVDSVGNMPLAWAVKKGHTEIVEELLANGADVNAQPVLLDAVPRGAELVRLLLEAGADLEAHSFEELSPLYLAQLQQDTEVVQLLQGAAAVQTPSTNLWEAAFRGDVQGVQRYLAEGVDVDARDENGWTALIAAVMNDHLAAVRALLDAGAAVDTTNARGETALMHAVLGGHRRSIQELISGGADVNARSDAGATALSWARRAQRPELIRLLEEAGAEE